MQPTVPQPPQAPNPAPVPPTPPTPPQPPQPAPINPQQPVQSFSGMPPATNLPTGQPKSSKKLIIIGVAAAILLAIFGALFYFANFSDAAVSKKTSAKFMKAMTTGNIVDALAVSVDSSSETKSFLESMAPGIKGEYSLKESGSKDQKRYFLYSLKGAENQAARTELEKNTAGKWVVSGLFSGGENLALIGAESSDDAEPNTATPAPSGTSACLVATDFDNIYKEINGATRPATPDYTKQPYSYKSNIHFNPDTLTYRDPASLAEGTIKAWTNFGVQNKDKQFVIKIQGSVGTAAASDAEFANQRAEKIKTALVAGGVPASKIQITSPKNVTDATGDTFNSVDQGAARNVIMEIDASCTSADPSSSNGR